MTLVWLFARGKWYDTNLSVLQNLNSRIEGMKHQQMENLPYRLIHRQKEIRNEKEREEQLRKNISKTMEEKCLLSFYVTL